MAALTLNEAAKLAADNGETKKAAIIQTYADKSDILAAMKFEGIAGNAVSYVQEGEISTTAFRGINEEYVPNTGAFNPQKEALYIAGGELDVDKFIVVTQGQEVRARHEAFKVKALAVGVTTALLSGSNATDPSSFNGLQTRITESSQLFHNSGSSGGGPLSLANLDQAIDNVENPTHLIMSRTMRRLFLQAYRSSTFPNIIMGEDDMGKQIMSYNDLPILVGYPPGKNTQILPFTEAASGGGSADCASIYVVNLDDDGCVGISNGGIRVVDLGELQSKPVYRTRVEWYLGFANYTPYARARLDSITNAAIVA